MVELAVGVAVGVVVVVVAVGVGNVVGVAVGDVNVVGVGVGVAAWVGDEVAVAVGDDVAVLLAVAEGCVPWVNPVDWDAGAVVGLFDGAFDNGPVAVGVAGGRVVSPARDAVGLTPTLDPPPECDVSRTATTATTAAAAAAASSQGHRRNADGRRPGGGPPVPPGMSRPAAVNGPDTGTRDVSGRRPCSTRVAEADSSAAAAGTTGAREVAS